MAMRENVPWIAAVMLAVLSIAPLSAEESVETAPSNAVEFVAPAASEGAPPTAEGARSNRTAATPSAAVATEEAIFVSPDVVESTETPRQGRKPAAPGDVSATIKKKVDERAYRDRNPNTMFDQRAGQESVLGHVDKATNATFRADGTPEEAFNVADKPGEAAPKPPPFNEKGPFDIVKGGFSAENPQGALAYFKGKTLVETSYYQALQRALDKNLNIRFSEKAYERSRHSVIKAKSIFDPVFSLQVNGTQTDTFERREFISRRRFIAGEIQNEVLDSVFDSLTDDLSDGADEPVDAFARRGAFDRVGSRARFRTETITQNFFKQLPWGSVFNAAFAQRHSKVIFSEFTTEDSFAIDDFQTFLGPAAQFGDVGSNIPVLLADGSTRKRSIFYEASGRIARDRLQRPWTSNLNLKLVVPLPYTKDWGPYGPAEVPTKLAEVARERAFWDLQGTVNSTMLTVNNAYWDVVRAIRRLELTITTRRGLETVFKQTEDQLKAGRSTSYEKTQVQLQLAGIRRGEQGEWARYVAASNALKSVLDQDSDVVILPVSYGPILGGVPPQMPDEAIAFAMSSNPEIQASKSDVKFAEISLKFAQNQSRPDLKLSTGMTWAQTDVKYGYSNVGASIASIMRPDKRDGFVALNFRMPWGNRPAEERLEQQEERYKQTQKRLSLISNQVQRNVSDSLTALNSAIEQAEIAEKNNDIANRLYKSVLDLWEKGRVPETAAGKSNPTFEIINKNNELLSAGFRLIDAQINLKLAEGKLLATQGTIASQYAENFKISIKPIEDPKSSDDPQVIRIERVQESEKSDKEPGKEAVK